MQQDQTPRKLNRYEISITDRKATDLPADFVPTIRNIVRIRDKDRDKIFLVVVHRLETASTPRLQTRSIVRFSERVHSPHLCSSIRLSTLKRLREDERLTPAQRDPMEGRLNVDATPLISQYFSKRGLLPDMRALSVSMVAQHSSDLWVYCTSICPGSTEAAHRLARRINKAYDTVTEIRDVDAFAIRLGIDFTLDFDASTDIDASSALNPLAQRLGAGDFEKIVHVHHGPMTYEDHSGVVHTTEDFVDLGTNLRACFTKPGSHSWQSEYRFALSTTGNPKQPTLSLSTSNELRGLTQIRD